MSNYRTGLQELMEAEYAAYLAKSNGDNARSIADNLSTTEMFKRQRKMNALSAGLKACTESGLDRETIHKLVDAAFDEAVPA